MSKTALLLPGQGSQRVGMGRDLVHEFPLAREVFDEADDALGFSISKLCFDGPEDQLALTKHTQPAVLTNSIAVLRVLQQEAELTFDLCAGHSLGEWTALVAVGALSFSDAVKLVHQRGTYMQEAVAEGQGAMAALMGLSGERVAGVCEQAAEGQVVSAANHNGAGQIVISGHTTAVERAVVLAKEAGARRAVMLHVSAPFHCALMEPAAQKLAASLEAITIAPLAAPVVANVDAQVNSDAARVKELLIQQITSPVRWEDCVRTLASEGVDRGFELGSGSVLAGLVKRIAKEIAVTTIGEPHEVREQIAS